MPSLYDIARGTTNRRTLMDFNREAEEFEARRKQRQAQEQMQPIQMQKAQLELQQMEKELASGVASNDPAAVREWNFYSKLSPAEQQKYLSMKRSDQIMNLGGQMAVRSPTGGIQESYTVTPKITETPQYRAAQAGAAEQAKIGAQIGGLPELEAAKFRATEKQEAISTLPMMEEKAGQILGTIEDIKSSPGFSAVVGAPNPLQGGFGAFNIPGTPAATAQSRIDRLGGQVFLQAYEELKGGGVITEIEGQKAERAIAALDQAQEESEYLRALNDLEDVVKQGLNRARAKAGRSTQHQPAQGRQRITLDEFLSE